MQCSCPRVMTSPEASSSRNFAGKIRRPLSSSLGVKVPRNIHALLHSPNLTFWNPSPPYALHFTPLVPTRCPICARSLEDTSRTCRSEKWGGVGGIFRPERRKRLLRSGSSESLPRRTERTRRPERRGAWRERQWVTVEGRGGLRWSDVGNEVGHAVGRHVEGASAQPSPRCDRAVTASPPRGAPPPNTTMPRLIRAGASVYVCAVAPRAEAEGGQRRGSSPARFSQRSSILRMKLPSPPEEAGPEPPPPPPGESSPSAGPLGAVTA